jgi:hypothetical protein
MANLTTDHGRPTTCILFLNLFLDVPFDSANVLDRKSVLAGEAHELRKANREAKECRKRGGVTRPDRRVSREMMTFTPQRFHVWVYTRLATD